MPRMLMKSADFEEQGTRHAPLPPSNIAANIRQSSTEKLAKDHHGCPICGTETSELSFLRQENARLKAEVERLQCLMSSSDEHTGSEAAVADKGSDLANADFIIDPEKGVVDVSSSWAMVTGLKPSCLVGKGLSSCFPGSQLDLVELGKMEEEAKRTGQGSAYVQAKRGNGERFMGYVTLKAVQDGSKVQYAGSCIESSA